MKDFVIHTTGEVVKILSPDEYEVYDLISESVFERFSRVEFLEEADDEVSFGGIEFSIPEIVTFIVYLLAQELVKQGVELTARSLLGLLQKAKDKLTKRLKGVSRDEAEILSKVEQTLEEIADKEDVARKDKDN